MSRTTLSGFSSRAIHHGYDPAENQGALTPPMHLASTFAFESAEQGGAIFAGEEPGYFYSRIGNPTVDLLEQRLAVLEGAEAGVAAASGMGAITAVMWSLLEAGDEIVTDKTLYGCTFAFFRHGLAKFGVKVTHVDLTDPEALEAAMHGGVKVVYFETPANPNMRLVDIAAISEVAHRHDAQVVVDNTYATPALTRPIELGADIVVHSATKYLGGHGDLVGGLVAGSAETMQKVSARPRAPCSISGSASCVSSNRATVGPIHRLGPPHRVRMSFSRMRRSMRPRQRPSPIAPMSMPPPCASAE